MTSNKTSEKRPIRVVLGRLGVDKHSRAALVVCKALRDAGMEVIYLGYGLLPESIVNTAVQEGSDVIALSSHCNYHRMLFPKVMQLLKEKGREDICVVAGGIIPPRDKEFLESIGITGSMGPGTPTDEIVKHIKDRVDAARLGHAGAARKV